MKGFYNPFLSIFRLHFNVLLIFQICCIVSLNAQDIDAGASLYKANCTSCHYMGPYEKKLIGPGLNAEILDKYSREWLYDWIRNSSELIESGDKQAVAIYEEFNKAVMTAFPQFSNEDIDNILAYIEQGPEEEVVEIAAVQTVEATETSQTTLFIILALVLGNLILLIYVKNVLKTAAGVKKVGFFFQRIVLGSFKSLICHSFFCRICFCRNERLLELIIQSWCCSKLSA